ncbi:hypothetical protein ES703_08868 [subsurface metagenome]
MKLFILIIILVITAIGIYFGCCVLRLQKRNKQLQADRNELIKEKAGQSDQLAKQSDQLRQKGIEIDELKKELKKYSGIEPKVALTVLEKRMILNALEMPHYQLTVQDPKTNYFIREIYRKLKEKIKENIKE